MTTTVNYDLADLDFELSEQLAHVTPELGLQNCHARAKAALKAAPKKIRKQLHYVEGTLFADQGMEPHGHGDHAWLLWVQEDAAGDYIDVRVIDPTLIAFFEEHGVPSGLAWEITE